VAETSVPVFGLRMLGNTCSPRIERPDAPAPPLATIWPRFPWWSSTWSATIRSSHLAAADRPGDQSVGAIAAGAPQRGGLRPKEVAAELQRDTEAFGGEGALTFGAADRRWTSRAGRLLPRRLL
jgi:hypothetical protein